MKITIQDRPDGEEDEIIVRCRHLDDRMLKMIYALKAGQEKLTVLREGKFVQISPKEIYYFEAVDNKVFAYLEKDVYECRLKLYELEQRFAETDFFRATKSTIVNLAWVRSFSPAFNGRFELLMKNGEKLIVSRQYVPDLKAKLGL
ncbi:MAG: LytTR family transcriptional regulator DNA-binding domain-containing protein [Blautia sp.]|nr:LytTR family transcriptional regulator DNA-binding domain-containing protein [Blautia sp.]